MHLVSGFTFFKFLELWIKSALDYSAVASGRATNLWDFLSDQNNVLIRFLRALDCSSPCRKLICDTAELDSLMKKSLGNLVVIDAPSNLGLSPPAKHSIPGCYKMPWVLHNLGLLTILDADYLGTLIPPRYNGYWEEGMGDRNAVEIANYSSANFGSP